MPIEVMEFASLEFFKIWQEKTQSKMVWIQYSPSFRQETKLDGLPEVPLNMITTVYRKLPLPQCILYP